MGVISYPSNFFGNGAVQHKNPTPIDDRLEQAILAAQQKDAAIVRRAFARLTHWLLQPESNANDRLEQAILACQRRDAAIVRHLLID